MKETPKILVLVGLPASGKTTYARELVSTGKWKRVNKDDIRAMVDSGKHSRKNEETVKKIEEDIVHHLVKAGSNVVIDSTNFAYVSKWEQVAKSLGAEFEVKRFDTTLLECIERDAKRGDKSVGAKVIHGMYERYVKPKLLPFDYELDCAYVFDIDGTLAVMGDRSPYDFDKVDRDTPNRDVVNLLKIISSCCAKGEDRIIIVSGRDSSCREKTERWLESNGIPYDYLYMRPEGDTRKDSVVKEEIYREHIFGRFNVLGVFDDRERVVEMWRSLGLTVFQVDWGKF